VKEIVRVRFGSHLYGTNTAHSDEDWKGVFMPIERDILLGRIPRSSASVHQDDTRKNLPGELDLELYSLHHFVKLATQGQTVALDMLFAPASMIQKGEQYWIWESIQEHRKKLLSKSMNAFIGYARTQAAKYSLRGERFAKLQAFYEKLHHDGVLETSTLSLLWGDLPRDDERTSPQKIRELQIAGKWFGETTPLWLVRESVETALGRYGDRSRASAEGVDWKAMSHAVRVSRELQDILTKEEIVFPLPYAAELLEIKQGNVSLERVQEMLDELLESVERLAAESGLPDNVDHKFWDDWLYQTIRKQL
jgi:hypothetical protein